MCLATRPTRISFFSSSSPTCQGSFPQGGHLHILVRCTRDNLVFCSHAMLLQAARPIPLLISTQAKTLEQFYRRCACCRAFPLLLACGHEQNRRAMDISGTRPQIVTQNLQRRLFSSFNKGPRPKLHLSHTLTHTHTITITQQERWQYLCKPMSQTEHSRTHNKEVPTSKNNFEVA